MLWKEVSHVSHDLYFLCPYVTQKCALKLIFPSFVTRVTSRFACFLFPKAFLFHLLDICRVMPSKKSDQERGSTVWGKKQLFENCLHIPSSKKMISLFLYSFHLQTFAWAIRDINLLLVQENSLYASMRDTLLQSKCPQILKNNKCYHYTNPIA